ncbi:MAG TPA: glycosyltransferase family 2 protein [Burkholderiales bacterium]|nr:glycosyltransferase family 2 protein [Burkholderiales bacterium]
MTEFTILMPCLNEAATVGKCVAKARGFLAQAGVDGEVLVADNGSTDESRVLAERAGARVVEVPERGYGAALKAGIAAAQGRYIIMGDADDSYDFAHLDAFVDKLRSGHPLVMGNRFKGGIQPGAMPALHRYFGNPLLSFIGRLFFRTRVGDFHCGLRGFDRAAALSLDLRTPGMEFASELVVKAALAGWPIAEVPTTLGRDGRYRAPHLRSWRDGWRHLRFLLLFSPRWLFLYPGLVLLVCGLALTTALYFAPLHFAGAGLDIHSMLYASAGALLGLQLCLFALFARTSAQAAGFLPRQASLERLLRVFSLERGLVGGFIMALIGFIWSAATFWQWREAGFGGLDPRIVMRHTIPASALMVAGMEIMLASFLLSILRWKSAE